MLRLVLLAGDTFDVDDGPGVIDTGTLFRHRDFFLKQHAS